MIPPRRAVERFRRGLLGVLLLASATGASAQQARATRVFVDKSEHRMDVFAGDRLLASFPVGLGVNPVGPKQQEGDRRTPEGRYTLDYRNAGSAFFRSIHVSYPDAADRARARRLGVSPGGAIMVHGQPNDAGLARRVRAYPFPDWTDGCIALSNADMAKLWDLVRGPTPIEIVP